MRSLLAASDDCIKVIDLEGKLSFMSEGGQRVMEVSDFNAIKGCPWPDFWADQGNADAKFAIEEARAGRSFRFQGAANTAAGNPRFWDVQVGPIIGPDGKPEAILAVSRDITVIKEAEQRQRLLALELKHRMKNTVAMIQAIANQTIRGGPEVDAIKEAFVARLTTMASAQDILTQSVWAKASLAYLIKESLKGHGDLTRFRIEGPTVELSSKTALAMALALHELATNATKYGALSEDKGRIDVSWSVVGGEFNFEWRESGGPPVEPPTRRGFGSRMIERALAGYFSGTAGINYEPSGVFFALRGPIEALTAD
ncbi:sensor histidine kinase [Bosea sp. BIWAKO-01]|uniref:sensor histidine kinase n=1 Tax=Bosea sp. BIWAKO-01 TaxID=506668 RepID=UPI000853583E|nr:HWE histidine kinase domain-containing protein [Bosea sp. BIWAKO-01]